MSASPSKANRPKQNTLPPRPELRVSAQEAYIVVQPELALEIGLNESMVLLQIAYWIKIASDSNFHDGHWWTYQSVRDIQSKSFPFWSLMTINRAVNKLIDDGYLVEGNYNKLKSDKTRWFALNTDKIATLKSVTLHTNPEKSVYQNDTTPYQNVTGLYQNDTTPYQNDTTLPVLTSTNTNTTSRNEKTPQEKSVSPVAKIAPDVAGAVGGENLVRNSISNAESDNENAILNNDQQTTMMVDVPSVSVVKEAPKTSKPRQGKKNAHPKEPQAPREPDRLFNGVALLCFGIDMRVTQASDVKDLAGRIAKISSWLRERNATPEQLHNFGKDYKAKHDGLSLPKDLAKFQEYWLKFEQGKISTRPKMLAPQSTYIPWDEHADPDEFDRLLKAQDVKVSDEN